MPPSTITPKAQAESPIIEPTDRSISALMMTKAMTRAMMIFSTESWKRLIWFETVRKSEPRLALTA